MKIGGKTVTPPAKELLVIPREDGDLVFWAQAIQDYDEFEEKSPAPKPPVVQRPGEGGVPDYEDGGYLTQLANHNKRRLGYLVIKTLEPSNIEWDSVKPDNPSTWQNWEEDFRKAGLTNAELNRLFQLVMDANNLVESKFKAAKEAFLRGRQQA